MQKIELGKIGEALAVNYLKQKGYQILETNYRNKLGELDVIAYKDKTTIFVEVKTRTDDHKGMPREAVNYYKKKKLIEVATVYQKSKGRLDERCRFDCIEIMGGEDNYRIEHIENILD